MFPPYVELISVFLALLSRIAEAGLRRPSYNYPAPTLFESINNFLAKLLLHIEYKEFW